MHSHIKRSVVLIGNFDKKPKDVETDPVLWAWLEFFFNCLEVTQEKIYCKGSRCRPLKMNTLTGTKTGGLLPENNNQKAWLFYL